MVKNYYGKKELPTFLFIIKANIGMSIPEVSAYNFPLLAISLVEKLVKMDSPLIYMGYSVTIRAVQC
jgi:hypothetical protein